MLMVVVVMAVQLISLAHPGLSGKSQRVRPATGVKSRVINDSPQPTQNDEFDWKLIKNSLSKYRGNVALSTFSAKFILNMLYEGAIKDSQTQRELSDSLQRNPSDSGEVNVIKVMKQVQNNPEQLLIANQIFADEEIQVTQKYLSTVSMLYNASVLNVNFKQSEEAAQKINKWVEEGTRGQIDQLVSADSIRDAVLLLANTIYFKGLWSYVFVPAATVGGPFKTSDGRTVNVTFMKQINDLYFTESQQLKAQVLRLPYADSRFSMILVLPKKDSNLNQLISALSPESMRQAITALEETEVKVVLPRFRIDYSTSLKQGLQQLGINRIFQSNAELGGISRYGNLAAKVSDIFQRTVIDVDEKGSTASSASGSSLVFTIANEPEQFIADRPFLFFIEEESTGSILFAGKVEEPLK